MSYPDGGQATYGYPNTQQTEVRRLITGTSCTGSNCTDSWTEVDGLDRPSRDAVGNGGEAGGGYDQIDVCYSPTTLSAFSSYLYLGSGLGTPNGTRKCSAGDTTAFDALGRVSSLVHSTDSSHPINYGCR